MPTILRRLPALGGALMLAALATGSGLNPGQAFAGFSICRTDPLVHLSDGATVKIVANIGDTAADIQKVVYTVHVPSGVGVTGITYTGGSLSGKETLTVYADDAAGTYDTTTTATGHSGTTVSAATTVATKSTTVSKTAAGLSGQALSVHILAP